MWSPCKHTPYKCWRKNETKILTSIKNLLTAAEKWNSCKYSALLQNHSKMPPAARSSRGSSIPPQQSKCKCIFSKTYFFLPMLTDTNSLVNLKSSLSSVESLDLLVQTSTCSPDLNNYNMSIFSWLKTIVWWVFFWWHQCSTVWSVVWYSNGMGFLGSKPPSCNWPLWLQL